MRILIPLAAIAGGAAVGLTVGLALRGHSSPARANDAASKPVYKTGQTNSDKKTRRARPAPLEQSPLATRLAYNLSTTTGVTKWLCWWEAIEKAKPEDFPALARLAKGNAIATKLVAQRWVETAPRQFFQSLVAASKAGNPFPYELENVLLNEWTKTDPEAVIAAMKEAGDFPNRSSWQHQVAEQVIEHNVERGLQLMSDWHIENYGPRLVAVPAWAQANPQHAADFTIANPAGYATSEIMKEVGKVWSKSDPTAAMNYALGTRGQLGTTLGISVLQNWAARDLNSAAEWLASADPSTRNLYSPAFVEAWAKQEAPDALAWCEANLSGSSLANSVGAVFKGAAAKDISAAADLVSGMQPSPARSEAAVSVADRWFPEFGSGKPVAPETIAWINSLDDDSRNRVLSQLSWKWSENDPKSLADFLLTSTANPLPSQIYSTLAQNMARKSPMEALTWANQLPNGLGPAAGSGAFGEWGRSQPDQAMAWFNELPANDARRQPFFDSLIQRLAWEPGAINQFTQVAATDPSSARKAIEGMSLPDDRRSVLLGAISREK
jgi:hypothetical protein